MRFTTCTLLMGLLSVAMALPALAQSEPVPFRPIVKEVRVDGSSQLVGGLGDTLLITVEGSEAEQLWRSRDKLRLYLNGSPIPALPLHVEPTRDRVWFTLARNEENREAWNGLLKAWKDQKVDVGLGLQDGPGRSDAFFHLRMLPTGRAVIALGIALVVLIGMTILGRRTAMLRDPVPAGAEATPLEKRTYSLGRTQMAWWTVMIVLALLALWCLTGSIEPVSGSMLALMGIGAGTFLGAALIDDATVQGAPAAASERQGFLHDLLREEHGISLHRFQMVIWTLIVTVVFWTAVVTQLKLPEIDATLLGLLGISNSTYLGFKSRQPPPKAPSP